VGLVGMFFTALSYAAMSRAFPLAGSVYTYAQRGLHETAGFFSGWLILLDYILVPSLLYLFSAVALRPIFPAVPAWLWLTGFISFNAIVNLLGIEFTARVNKYMLVMELSTLALFVGLGLHALYHGVGGNLNAIGRATVWSLLLVGALFMLQTWIAADLAEGMRFSSPDTAFYEVSERAGGPWLRLITILAIVIAQAIANAMAAQAAVSRILFAMARDGKLPAVLAKVHPRYQTPYVSTLAVAVVSLLVGLFFAARVDDLTQVVNFGALSGFALLHLSVINHYLVRRRSGDWLRHFIFPLTGLGIILYVLYEMDRAAKILGACWIAIGIVYYAALALRSKKPAVLGT
jgi:amino acid transporter